MANNRTYKSGKNYNSSKTVNPLTTKKNTTSKVSKNNSSKPVMAPIITPKAMNGVPVRTTHSKGNKAWSPSAPVNSPIYGSLAKKPNGTSKMNKAINKTQTKKDFMSALDETRNSIYGVVNNISITENGAVGYKTSGSDLLDMNFQVASLRKATEKEIIKMWRKAYAENPMIALRWLFYCRDIRGGMGERRLFRLCMNDMARNGREDVVNALIPLFAEYGRYDDLWSLLDITATRKCVLKFVHDTLREDIEGFKADKSISLLAKWLPSENASSAQTAHYGAIIRKSLKWTPRQYRQTLSNLRKHIDVVERKMSASQWDSIDYEAVPSKANLKYNDAFLKHDEERRRTYLGALSKGEAKINSSTAFPHEIAGKYMSSGRYLAKNCKDEAIEGMWRSLPDYVNGMGSTICVADGSGSMTVKIGNGNTSALTVANSLAIYFAERCSGVYKNKYITFSETPQLVHLGNGASLYDKMKIALKHCEAANTNIEAVFDLILDTAIKHEMSQDEIPQNILIVSDMEFDSCAEVNPIRSTSNRYGYRYYNAPKPTKALFDIMAERYRNAGYKLPRLVFWNLNSRTKTIPMTQNEMGVVLVSGFSPATLKMVLTNKTDPYDCLLETVMNKRYDAVTTNLVKAGLVQ